jgi:P4 family phage/plasmid primase-like protien
MKLYAKKLTAQKYLKPGELLCNQNIKNYFILGNYNLFLNLIKQTKDASFFEYVSSNSYVPIFFDIEVYESKNPDEFNNDHLVIDTIKNTIIKLFQHPRFIILESHSEIKRSYHIIIRDTLLFENVKCLKDFINTQTEFKHLISNKILDTSVYREGLFRTIHSTKFGENRPFKQSKLSDTFSELESFIGLPGIEPIELYGGLAPLRQKKDVDVDNVDDIGADIDIDTDVIEPQQKELTVANKTLLKKFIKKQYNYNSNDVRDIKIDSIYNCIVIALTDRFCHNVDRDHNSNFQYIIIDSVSSKQKCHDPDCVSYKYSELLMELYPKELNELIKTVLKVNKQELELIDNAIKECKDYITENFDEDISIETIQFDRSEMVFRGNVSNSGGLVRLNGKCNNCQIEHQITHTGYCLKCIVCKSIFPKNQVIPVDDRYKHLNNFWNNYSQLTNNGTVNININNTFYNNAEEDFNCDIQLDTKIFNDKNLTRIYNQVLDGHKVIKISELISILEIDFKYTNGEWYYFNGSIWKMDKESLEFRKKIVGLSIYFNRIQSHYEHKKNAINNTTLVKNVKSLINKLHKPGFEDEIIKGAKMYYNDETFMSKLNSKKHLVPFTDGVYDLLSNEFRKTTKEDYINLTVGFPYTLQYDNQEVYKFLREVLPSEGVRDYVLKKMSECLNGDIPNTYFLMFIGDTGANGKSQLLNLMKLCMGEFGEKVEVTLLTRKRNNANEANTEKIKLLNKRFAFLSEPEDGEKINIGLLKELTGSEEIVARGLYQDSLSFVMEAKLFLACNELPEIKGEDTALWRRIRAVDFPSRFIDEPNGPGEYKIDRTLPSRMREDLTWRQTFMKILLDYYYRDNIKEPEEIKVKTNEYRQENNEFYSWLDQNIEKTNSNQDFIELKTVCELFLNKVSIPSRTSSKYRKEIEKYIKEKFKTIDHEYKQRNISDSIRPRGWIFLKLKN